MWAVEERNASGTSKERSRPARRSRVVLVCFAASTALGAGRARAAPESAGAPEGRLPLLAILGAFCGPAGIYRERAFEAASINPRITSPT